MQLVEAYRYAGAVSALSFAYSPWSTIGIIPIALRVSFGKNHDNKKVINVLNILIPVLMLIFFGMFYMAGSGTYGSTGTIFSIHPENPKSLFFIYLLFLFIEVGVYYAIMGKTAEKYRYYWMVFFEL